VLWQVVYRLTVATAFWLNLALRSDNRNPSALATVERPERSHYHTADSTESTLMHYSALSLVKQALTGNRGWTRAWRNPEPRKQYDVIIIGGGGHGLATAYYLAKLHGVTNVAVLEKGYIGGGNTGRNTTIVRSNYMLNANSQFYEHSMKLWEGLSQDLNYNVMFSQRGVLTRCASMASMP
jgi:sarcosine oxidase subunit beta